MGDLSQPRIYFISKMLFGHVSRVDMILISLQAQFPCYRRQMVYRKLVSVMGHLHQSAWYVRVITYPWSKYVFEIQVTNHDDIHLVWPIWRLYYITNRISRLDPTLITYSASSWITALQNCCYQLWECIIYYLSGRVYWAEWIKSRDLFWK